MTKITFEKMLLYDIFEKRLEKAAGREAVAYPHGLTEADVIKIRNQLTEGDDMESREEFAKQCIATKPNVHICGDPNSPCDYSCLEKAAKREIKMRQFDTGATRDLDDTKLDFEGFLSPLVLKRYAEYLNKHRKQVDGKMRASDNWQKGIPLTVYMKSMWRHFVDVWATHRLPENHCYVTEDMEEALCAVIFNASGYLHELLKQDQSKPQDSHALCDDDLISVGQ